MSVRLGQAEQSRLRGRVVRLSDVAGFPDHRGDVDDPPGAAGQHVLQRGLGHEEGTGEVDGDDPQPVLITHLGHGPVDGDPGVVDQDVQAAVLLDDLADDAAAVLGAADVAVVQGDQAAGVVTVP